MTDAAHCVLFYSFLIGINMHIITCVPIVFLLMQSNAVYGEMFTALVDMEGLVSTELELVRHLDNYIQAEEIRLKRLRGKNNGFICWLYCMKCIA
jgi:hypothetical protein